MLILMRRENESIIISHDIEVIPLKINQGSVVLSIRAPNSINIMREERAAELKDSKDIGIGIIINTDESGTDCSERIVERRVEESVLIGTDIKIVIFRIVGRQVSIGVKADRSISVFRKECLEPTEPSNYY